ncbi:hypothetical protein C4585_00550 [Candidatus Parcubacteria bacterium]|nr:MAG: hypothetical protein C4585_00550 [Candidatus Parcubacteria bacterium]
MFKKLASIVIGSILLVSPSVSSAQTLAELQAQVLALLAQLNALQAQIAAQTNPGSESSLKIVSSLPAYGSVNVQLRLPQKYSSGYIVFIINPVSVSKPVSSGALLGMEFINDPGNQGIFNNHLSLVKAHEGFATNQGGVHWFDLPSGRYTLAAVVYPYSPFKPGTEMEYLPIGTEPAALKIIESAEFDLINDASYPKTISVTSPNGGEQWEIGQLNTITWAPYGYNPTTNPPKDVTVYLQRTNGTIVGKIMDTGKASLHTYFNIDSYEKWATPGQYYVYVKNNVTGASDRSDNTFTLLPRSVDVKVNGSDGPISLTVGQRVKVEWKSTGTSNCRFYGLGGTLASIIVESSGSAETTYVSGGNINLSCLKTSNGSGVSDSVIVSSQWPSSYSLNVISPNGGEQIEFGKPYDINWKQQGLKSVSIALYSNDQWKQWIVKDFVTPSSDDSYIYQWTPTQTDAGVARYKIYITGQKIDGTGYVDDKSDAPFEFSSTGSTSGTVNGGTFSTNKPTITGTASNVAVVGISIDNGDKVYGSGNTISVANGKWSHTVTQALPDGEYKVDLYSSSNVLLDSTKFAVRTATTPTTVRGTYQGYLNGKLFITTRDITEVDALANCKKNANNNPRDTIRCTWNNKEIYKRDGASTNDKEKGTYRGYMNNRLFIETKDITEADALANCKVNDKNNPRNSILCVWKDKEIYRRAAPATVAPSVAKGTYKGYLNGALFITTKDITQSDALENCKKNANNNKNKSIRCTWDGTNIYERAADTSKKPTCTLKANPGTVPSGGSTTLTWVTTNANWVKLDDGKTDYGSVNKDGSKVFTKIKKDTTFTLRVDGKEKVNCTKTVKVSNSSGIEGTPAENLASALAALEAALHAINSLVPEEQ